ncbi:TPA: hypothetical protein IAB95_01420 [Candidatus Ventrenecus avicola]|nr:hypothetical protein [Candidatus Ventrenecus avicola]
MKKIKELWNKNRVMFVLTTIVIVCFIIILVVVLQMFFGVSSSPYGDRLDNIQDMPFTDENINAISTKIQESEGVSEVEVHCQGKIIYIRITFNNVTIDKAKEIATTALEAISEEYQALYDVHFTIVQEESDTVDGFTLMGSKNINRTTVTWNNNTAFTVDEDSTEE